MGFGAVSASGDVAGAPPRPLACASTAVASAVPSFAGGGGLIARGWARVLVAGGAHVHLVAICKGALAEVVGTIPGGPAP